MKKNLALYAFGGENWIGGLYYIKNVAYEIGLNEYINENFNIYLFTTIENASIYRKLPNSIKLIELSHEPSSAIGFLRLNAQYHINYSYPARSRIDSLGTSRIVWIPDFQVCHLPSMFSRDEVEARKNYYKTLVKRNETVVLSSCDSKRDFMNFFGAREDNLYVLHFVSAIEDYIVSVSRNDESNCLKKIGLYGEKYVVIMNQFWKHKNHLTVLNAIQKISTACAKQDVSFVFTGKVDDYRSPEYTSKIKEMLEKPEIKNVCKLLGFLERKEQITIMKNAEFVIQPSLFEGWGTVVEDAKVLDKTILLSDIPVHREQMNSKCKLFIPNDPNGLAEMIDAELQIEHIDDIKNGLSDMKRRAIEYSKGFEQLLRDKEKNK